MTAQLQTILNDMTMIPRELLGQVKTMFLKRSRVHEFRQEVAMVSR